MYIYMYQPNTSSLILKSIKKINNSVDGICDSKIAFLYGAEAVTNKLLIWSQAQNNFSEHVERFLSVSFS